MIKNNTAMPTNKKKKTYSVLIYKDDKLYDILKSSEFPEVLKYDVLYK